MAAELLYIDAVEGPESARADQEIVLTIRGNRPDPSWAWDRNDIAISDATVTIDVLGKRGKAQMSAMVLVPFTTTATLSRLPSGTLTILVRGRQRTIEHRIQVEP